MSPTCPGTGEMARPTGDVNACSHCGAVVQTTGGLAKPHVDPRTQPLPRRRAR